MRKKAGLIVVGVLLGAALVAGCGAGSSAKGGGSASGAAPATTTSTAPTQAGAVEKQAVAPKADAAKAVTSAKAEAEAQSPVALHDMNLAQQSGNSPVTIVKLGETQRNELIDRFGAPARQEQQGDVCIASWQTDAMWLQVRFAMQGSAVLEATGFTVDGRGGFALANGWQAGTPVSELEARLGKGERENMNDIWFERWMFPAFSLEVELSADKQTVTHISVGPGQVVQKAVRNKALDFYRAAGQFITGREVFRRTRPTSESKAVGYYTFGEAVRIEGREGSFLRISQPYLEGQLYVHHDFVGTKEQLAQKLRPASTYIMALDRVLEGLWTVDRQDVVHGREELQMLTERVQAARADVEGAVALDAAARGSMLQYADTLQQLIAEQLRRLDGAQNGEAVAGLYEMAAGQREKLDMYR